MLGQKWQKGYFHTSHLTPNQKKKVFPEREVLESHSLLSTLSKLKDKLTGLHKILLSTKVYLLLKLIASQQIKETWPPESLAVIHESCGAKLQ